MRISLKFGVTVAEQVVKKIAAETETTRLFQEGIVDEAEGPEVGMKGWELFTKPFKSVSIDGLIRSWTTDRRFLRAGQAV